MRKRTNVKLHFFPETAAGGFSRVDGTIEFYGRINALLDPKMTVMDFGAGRGSSLVDDPSPYRRDLRRLQGKVRKVVGVDIDDAIGKHPALDERHTVKVGEALPFRDETFDLVVSDYVFEHVDDPFGVSQELDRILKPGGWICARTPHRWGYIGIGTNSVPNRLHPKMLARLQKGIRKEQDIFPTRYRLNTLRAIERYFPKQSWENYCYGINPEPAYFGNSKIAWALMLTYFDLMPRFGPATVILVFLKKRQIDRRPSAGAQQ